MNSLSAPDPSLGIAYTDVGALEKLKHGGDESLKQAAQQFESVFVGLWLKSMREAGAAFSEGNYLSSNAVETHQEMLDSQWAVHLSESGGLGLAPVIERQLRGEPAPIIRDEVEPRPLVDLSAEPNSPLQRSEQHGRNASAFKGREEFVENVATVAKDVLQGSGLPLLGVLAQAALESGWGQHVPQQAGGASSHNLFGIKATGWNGDEVSVPTTEHLFGQWVAKTESFRAYDGIAASVEDLKKLLLEDSRYADVVKNVQAVAGDAVKEVAAFADALQESGYATDPRYADKLKAVADTLMRRFGVR